MVEAQCFEPSSLLVAIHKNVPFLTGGDREESVEVVLNLDEGTREFYDYFVRALFWGIFIVLVTIILLSVSCCCYCCSICCLCLGERGEEAKPKSAKCTCAILLLLIVLTCLSMCALGLWAEVEMDRRITEHGGDINDFLDVVINNSSQLVSGDGPVINPLIEAEEVKHWVTVGYFILLIVLLIAVTLAVICTPLCKTPATMVMIVALLTVVTFVTSMVAGGIFSFLIIFSDVCYGLHDLAEGEDCVVQAYSYTDSLDTFCNESFLYGVISFGVICGTILGYVLIQIFGAIYAGLLTGYTSHPLTKADIEMEGPSVWDAYGTHNVSGLTSDGAEVLDSFESTLQLYPPDGDKGPSYHSST